MCFSFGTRDLTIGPWCVLATHYSRRPNGANVRGDDGTRNRVVSMNAGEHGAGFIDWFEFSHVCTAVRPKNFYVEQLRDFQSVR
jgi:hypothetical protein